MLTPAIHHRRQHHRASSPTVCGSYDWSPAAAAGAGAGRCCINPPGSTVHLQADVAAVHSAKVATHEIWACPRIEPSTCKPQNTNPACAGLAGSAGETVVGHDFLLGFSRHDDGRQALTLHNFDSELTAAPTLVFLSATTNRTREPTKLQLFEVDPHSGLEVLAVDDIPDLPGLQISLDVAEARVFLIGPAPAAPPAPSPQPLQPPVVTDFPTFAVPGLPNASAPHAGFPLITGVVQQLVYTQDDLGTGSYAHQPIIGIVGPQGSQPRLIVAIKSHGDATVPGDEEGPGQRVLFAVSLPATVAAKQSASTVRQTAVWSPPQVLFPNITAILPHQTNRSSVVGIALLTCPFVRLRGRSYAYALALTTPKKTWPPYPCQASLAPPEWNGSSPFLPPLLRRVRLHNEEGCLQAVCLGEVFWLSTVFPQMVSKLVKKKPGQLILGQLTAEMRADAETLFDPKLFVPLGLVPTNTSTIHGGTVPGMPNGNAGIHSFRVATLTRALWTGEPCPPPEGCLSWERGPPLRLADGLDLLFVRNNGAYAKYAPGSGIQHSIWASTRQSGETVWSVPAPTGLPDAGSNFASGQLPDGRLFIVSNGGGVLGIRNPLTIFIAAAASGNSSMQFTKAMVVADGSPFNMPKSPSCELSYPSVVLAELNGVAGLWVVYSANEADVGASFVPLSALKNHDVALKLDDGELPRWIDPSPHVRVWAYCAYSKHN